eukprot:jgi/Mesvir1/15921/Mv08245-RA.1
MSTEPYSSPFSRPYGGVRKANQAPPSYPPLVTFFLPGVAVGALLMKWLQGGQPAPEAAPKKKKERTWSGPVPAEGTDMKMVLVVRKDLNMSVGKTAAQCAHATLGLYNKLRERHAPLLARWESSGQAKIVLVCESKADLQRLARAAKEKALPIHITVDAGRTERYCQLEKRKPRLYCMSLRHIYDLNPIRKFSVEALVFLDLN